jgi:hypothetical protein
VKRQPFLRRQAEILRFGIEAVYRAQRLQHVPAFIGKAVRDLRELPPSVAIIWLTR